MASHDDDPNGQKTMNPQSGRLTNPASADSSELNIPGLISAICDKFDQYYVYPDVAARMKSFMLGRLKSGQYDGFGGLEALTSQLASDMREVSEDGHVVVYPSGMFKFLKAETDTLSDKEKAEAARRNYGFLEVKRLVGNVGYVKLNYFTHPSIAGPTAAAAMQFLANTDAVIIDLRDNSGGEEAMVQFLLSYFFEEQKHLLNVYNNRNELIEQSWTCAYVPGKKMFKTELFVLISSRTGSGAEAFAFDLQCQKRATLIGETTLGIAHMVKVIDLEDYGVRIHVPYARPVNPLTNANWEKSGVKPDIEIGDDQALTVAHREAIKRLTEKATDDDIRRDLEWVLPVIETQGNPVVLSEEEMGKYTGRYANGKYSIVINNGKLCWRCTPQTDYRLTPINKELFGFDDTEDDRLQFVRDSAGDISGFQLIRKSGGQAVFRPKTGAR
jgi:hypothetical protein